MNKNDKILITGGKGMVGSILYEELLRLGYWNVISIGRNDCDLINSNMVMDLFDRVKPDYVFHLAARVGGINANNTMSGIFIYENLMIQCNVFEAARICNVRKLLFCGSVCVYPKECPQPIKEEYLMTSKLESTNSAYAVAKIAGIEMCKAYNKQYGSNFITVMPPNLYGEGDYFNPMNSHVIPGLFFKFNEAVMNKENMITVWGTGNVKREFLYVEDLVGALIFLMNTYDSSDHINIGSGKIISIKDLVNIIKDIFKYEGNILWDTSFPEGVKERVSDVSKINKLGWEAKTEIKEGLQKTYKWFMDNYQYIRK